MNNDEGLLQVDLLGTSFVLRTDKPPQYLDVLYNHYKIMLKHVENVTVSSDPLQTAIVAGILLADQFFEERKKNSDADSIPDLSEMEVLTLKMISSIDEVV